MPSIRGSGIVKAPKKQKALKRKVISNPESQATGSGVLEDVRKRPVYFWREYNYEYGFLSQWYLSPFSDPKEPEIVYQTAEQYMMYQKAILFSDPHTASLILSTSSPREQKSLGRQVQNFNEKVWLENRMHIVEQGSYLKFRYGGHGAQEDDAWKERSLKDRLLSTGERKIVEASPMDKIWGIGFGEKNADARKGSWGLNLLGICLMKARKRLVHEAGEKEEESSPVPAGHETFKPETEA